MKRTTLLSLSLVASLALAAVVAPAALAETRTVALRYDAVPGSGVYWSFGTPALNASGQVAFQAYIDGFAHQGLFLETAGAVVKIARDGEAAPGGTELFTQFNMPSLDASGWVGFFAFIDNGAHQGMFLGNGGAPVLAARDGWAAPDGSNFIGFGGGVTGTNGRVAFGAYLNDGTSGLFQATTGGGVSQVVGSGQSAPGGSTFAYFNTLALNAAGNVSFNAALNDATAGIFRSGDGLVSIARGGDAAPGGGTFTSSFGSQTAINASGQVAFAGVIDGSHVGLFRGDGSSLTKIARDGDTAATGETFAGFWVPTLNDAGQAAFKASISGGGQYGIFIGDGGTPLRVAKTGQAAPGGVFNEFAYPSINAGGTVAFMANVLNLPYLASGTGLYLADSQEVIEVTRMGRVLEGQAVIGLTATLGADVPTSGLNDFGQVAYQAALADGSEGVFLFTPTLHYRSATSGAWNTAANWTVGLAPAYVHDVYIDPDAGLTVTGPALTAAVKNLTIGARSSGVATLDLAGHGLDVAEDLTIDLYGRVTQRAGFVSVAGSFYNYGDFVQSSNAVLAVFSMPQPLASAPGDEFMENYGSMTLGGTVSGPNFHNYGVVVLDGGTVVSTPDLYNDYGGAMTGRGTIATNLTNYGLFQPTGLVTVQGNLYNSGSVALAAGGLLRINNIDNYGTIDLSGGAITQGGVYNAPGGVIRGWGAISSGMTNDGAIEVGNNQTLNLAAGVENYGDVILGGSRAILSGGGFSNNGLIAGLGRVSNDLYNYEQGTVRAEGGTLTLGGWVENQTGAVLEVSPSATLLLSMGLQYNDGSIVLRGGTFDNNGRTLDNYGSIAGYGTVRTGGLTIEPGYTVGAGGGNLDILGPVTNDGLVSTQAGCTTTFYGLVDGDGNFPGTGTVMFLLGYSPGHSPGDAEFGGDLDLGAAARLVMELAGTARGEEYDALAIGGTFAPGGTLDVALLYGYVPQYGDTFDLFDWAALAGAFDAINLPALGGGLGWDTSALYSSGTLSVMPEPATLALLALGAAMALVRRRRHN